MDQTLSLSLSLISISDTQTYFKKQSHDPLKKFILRFLIRLIKTPKTFWVSTNDVTFWCIGLVLNLFYKWMLQNFLKLCPKIFYHIWLTSRP